MVPHTMAKTVDVNIFNIFNKLSNDANLKGNRKATERQFTRQLE